MPTVANTTATLGGSAAAADVLVWLINGHPLPISQEVDMAIVVLLGIASHICVVGFQLFLSYLGNKKGGQLAAPKVENGNA